jgi:chromosome partitioning protein
MLRWPCCRPGQRVATIDLDSRQKSLTHYVENRRDWARRSRIKLEIPTHYYVARSGGLRLDAMEAQEFAAFTDAVSALENSHDFVVIDTPGADSYLMRLAHSMADTLITPLNDSFVDFGVLGAVDPTTFAVIGVNAATSLPMTATIRGRYRLTTDEFRKFVGDEIQKWAKVIKFAGIKPE